MNRFELFDAIKLYKNRLKHSQDYKYYNKLDNFYGPGKTRYFWSKEEWDAYQKEKQEMLDKAKKDVARRDEYNKNMQAQKAQDAQKQSNSRIVQDRKALLEANQNSREAAIKDNINREQNRIKRQEELKNILEKAQNARKREEQDAYWNLRRQEIKEWDKTDKNEKDINDALINSIFYAVPDIKSPGTVKKEVMNYLDIGKDKNWRVSKNGTLYYVGDNADAINKKVDEGWEAFEEWQNATDKYDQGNKWDLTSKKNYDAQKLVREDSLKENKSYNDAIFSFINDKLSKKEKEKMAYALRMDWKDIKKEYKADPSIIKALEDFIEEYTYGKIK